MIVVDDFGVRRAAQRQKRDARAVLAGEPVERVRERLRGRFGALPFADRDDDQRRVVAGQPFGGEVERFAAGLEQEHRVGGALDRHARQQRAEQRARALVADRRGGQTLAEVADHRAAPEVQRPDRLREHHRRLPRAHRARESPRCSRGGCAGW